uniref:Bromodomain-containing protein 8 n=1 Tax=Ornithorhynchus anatinus TaxID=9258 RepID=A0A6I8NGB5_ORNAN
TREHKLLTTGPTEPWSIREKLCLASSVMRSGDQNWVSVSRAIKPFAEPGRPPDWFSQKVSFRAESLRRGRADPRRRKRGEKGGVVETVEDVIVRKLTAERVEELKKMIRETQEKYRQLKRDAELIQAGHLDGRLDELVNDIAVKKKLEEEEAEVRRKATDAAYQARQAVKTPPRRLPSVTVRSPAGSASPGGECPLGELAASAAEEGGSGVAESEAAASSGHLSSPGVLLEVGGGVVPGLPGGEMPPTPGAIPASPAASGAPTLSRLLEAGPSQFSVPLASFAASAEPPAKHVPLPGDPGPQAAVVLQAPPSAPPAAVPESGAPASRPETRPPLEAVGERHTVTVSVDSSEISMIINSIKEECFRAGAAEPPGGSRAPGVGGREDLDLAQKMDIAVSYTGEELDFETVGDIIAIIEDKVDDHPEVLDVAAVEAALSFCEENDDPQSLSGPWEHSIRPEPPAPAPPTDGTVTVKQERLDPEEPEGEAGRAPADPGEPGPEIKAEPAEPARDRLGPDGAAGPEPPDLGPRDPGGEAGLGDGPHADVLRGKGDDAPRPTVKTEASPEGDPSPPSGPRPGEDPTGPEPRHEFQLADPLKEESGAVFGSQMKDAPGEDEDEDGASEAPSLEEPKEEDPGEGYLSEMDNEPPVSESEDGFSVHNAALQSHALADSIPSSPASSQFSVCSEDQEAIQAQKIWKKAIMLVWRAAANHRYANVFLQPVTDDIAPGYHSIVQRPMDLSTIKKNIENGLIRTTAEFQRDIMLMFQNAVMYNSSDHDVYHMAVEMQRDVLEQIQQFLATQLIMQTSESGISAKSLRGRDSHPQQDALREASSVLRPRGNPSNPPPPPRSPQVDREDVEPYAGRDDRRRSESPLGSRDPGPARAPGRWREVEEPGGEDPERSSPERGGGPLGLSDPEADGGSGKEFREEGRRRRRNVLQFLSEVGCSANNNNWGVPDGTWRKSPAFSAVLPLPRTGGSRGDPDQDHLLLKKTLLPVWKMIASHRFSSPFLKPVSDRQAPGYKDVVKRPMDLTSLKRSLSKGRIGSAAQFQRDLMLMFLNAVMYNAADHHVYRMAVDMQREVLEQIQVPGRRGTGLDGETDADKYITDTVSVGLGGGGG